MTTASELQKYLTVYDQLESAVPLTTAQQQFINTLRMLAKANPIADLSTPIEALIQNTSTLVSTSDTPSPLEKLVRVLSGVPFAEMSVQLSASEINNLTTAKQWLNQLIGEVQSALGGEFSLDSTTTSLNLTLNGPLTMKYSVFMALISCEVIPRAAYLDKQHITGDITVALDEANLVKIMQRSNALVFVTQYLRELGFQVEMGSKTCEQSLSQNSAFISKDNTVLKTSYNLSMDFANALAAMSSERIVLPLTLKITTLDDGLMQLLESYYAHPLVNLISRDGAPKTFIIETRATGCLHESVLNLNQLETLKDFFDRLSYFARYYDQPAAKLSESEIVKATVAIYTQIKNQINYLINPDFNFEVQPSYSTTSGINFFYTQVTLAQFETSIETLCKKRLIPGPMMFLNDTPFIKQFNQIQADIFQSDTYAKWPTFRESYTPSPNCNTPRSPNPLHYYAQAIARATLGQTATIGFTPEEHSLGIEWLNKTVNRVSYGSAANQQYYDFYTENNSYYLLDSLISCIKICLDAPRCSDHHIQSILELLNVSAASIKQLQSNVGGEQHFNRFQVKLFLIPLVLNGLCKNQLLANPQILAAKNNPWVKITNPITTSYASYPDNWYEGMRDWKNTEIQGIRWGVGGPASSSQQKRYQDTTQRNTLFAGGSAADQARQQQAQERSSVSYGSST